MTTTKSSDQILDSMKAEHGDRIVHAETPMGLVVCRPPTLGEHKRFSDKIGDARKSNSDAMKELVVCCRVYPEREDFKQIIERFGALCRLLADALDDAAGGDIEVHTGK